MDLILLLVLLLVVCAVVGGIWIAKILWILLLVALVVWIISAVAGAGRRGV